VIMSGVFWISPQKTGEYVAFLDKLMKDILPSLKNKWDIPLLCPTAKF
jgi:hypothetical protein